MSQATWWGRVFVGLVLVASSLASSAEAPAASGLSDREARVFQLICAECHTRAGLGAPVIGDEAEWEPRRAKGLGTLLANTVNGWLGMPPLGTCSFCTEEELRHLVAFMAGLPQGRAP